MYPLVDSFYDAQFYLVGYNSGGRMIYQHREARRSLQKPLFENDYLGYHRYLVDFVFSCFATSLFCHRVRGENFCVRC